MTDTPPLTDVEMAEEIGPAFHCENGTVIKHYVTRERYRRALARIEQDRAEIEQLRVQLAGCSVAAHGGTSVEVMAVEGQYGWSVAYQDVLECRRHLDTARAEIARLTAENAALAAYAAHRFECGEDGSGAGCTCGLARLEGK